MLLENYTKEIFRPECNPQFQSIHCFAHLDEDISEVLPYLNTTLGGSGYTTDPPSLMLQVHGRLIAFHPKKLPLMPCRMKRKQTRSWNGSKGRSTRPGPKGPG